jgi:uncharacterized protein (DUF983 family)
MEEQNKPQTEEAKKPSAGLKTVVKIILGIVFIALGLFLLLKWCWWRYLWVIIKGIIGPFLVLAGVITLAIAKD